MAGYLDISITASPDTKVFERRYTRFASKLTNVVPLVQELTELVWNKIQEGFETEGAATGPIWPALSTAYAEWKRAHAPGNQILVLTGALKAGITKEVRGSKGEVGTAVPYAIFHQTGTSKMPPRPIIRLKSSTKAEMGKIVHLYMLRHATGRI